MTSKRISSQSVLFRPLVRLNNDSDYAIYLGEWNAERRYPQN